MSKFNKNSFLERAIKLSYKAIQHGSGGPFGCVIVKNDQIIAEGYNMVIEKNDPTAHAEIVAIRQACRKLKSFQLHGCEIYASCEPCPMCLGAIYWARPERVIFANTRIDAAAIEFDDDFIYEEINSDMLQRKIPFIHHPHPLAIKVFEDWKRIQGRKVY